MKRRYTPNQQEYRKQIRRIKKALSALRRQGYDVSELAKQYTNELPKRITQNMLNELKSTKPSQLKKKATWLGYTPKKYEPLTTTPTNYTDEVTNYIPVISPTFDTNIEEALTEEETILFEPPEPISISDEETTIEEYADTLSDEEDFVDETPTITVQETENEILWIDTETGEIVDRVSKTETYNDAPDMSEQAIEYLRDICNQFSPSISVPLNEFIDRTLNTKGAEALAEAFTQSMNDRPNLLQMLTSVQTKYHAIIMLITDICDKLDLDEKAKDIFRDNITRESMADMDEYL